MKLFPKVPLRALLRAVCLVCLFAEIGHTQNTASPQPAAASSKRASDYINPALPRWLRFNGEYRVRVDGLDGAAFRPASTDAYALERLRLNVAITPSPWLKFQFQGQDAQVQARNAKPDAPPFEDTFDLRQAYVDIGNPETNTLSLRGGRQELVFGEQRLVGHLNWVNTARSFDAARVTYRNKYVKVDAFAASVVNPREGEFNKRTDGNNFHGIYAVFANTVPNAVVEPYIFWRVARGQRAESGVTGNLDFKTVGVRFNGKLPANFDYGIETAGQLGSLEADDIRAWAGHYALGYTIANAPATPRLIAEYNYASGDSSATDGKRQTFDQLYPTGHDKYGLADQVGWKNVHALRGGVELKPTVKLSVSGNYFSWWLASPTDGLYNAAGAQIARVDAGNAGSHIGQEADIQSVYAMSSTIQLSAGFANIFPGTFLKNATPGKSYRYAYGMIVYQF